MTSAIKDIKKKALPILKKAGVRRSAIFGSVARGEAGKRSDIDMLIQQPRGKFSLLDLVGLEMELSEKLGNKVDLLTYDGIHHLVKDYILRDAITIYEKRR